jgi:hypothetical protein
MSPEQAEWWYKLGVLQADLGSRGEAEDSIQRAIGIGETRETQPYWLSDAYRIGGEIAQTESATGRLSAGR